VLRVANAALRWRPPSAEAPVAPSATALPAAEPDPQRAAPGAAQRATQEFVAALRNELASPISARSLTRSRPSAGAAAPCRRNRSCRPLRALSQPGASSSAGERDPDACRSASFRDRRALRARPRRLHRSGRPCSYRRHGKPQPIQIAPAPPTALDRERTGRLRPAARSSAAASRRPMRRADP
jgi:hypothetical protein